MDPVVRLDIKIFRIYPKNAGTRRHSRKEVWMCHRFPVPMSVLAVITAVAWIAPAPAAGQAKTRMAAKTWTAPRTADGQPDLQGLWTNATITPFERPKDLAGKEFFTQQEAAAYEKRIAENSNRDKRGETAEADVAGAYNDFW